MSQVWLISGSGGGLGRDIAEAALAAGHRVVATARRVETLLGSDAATFAGDVEQARRDTDARWAPVSRSTDIGAAPMPAFPAY